MNDADRRAAVLAVIKLKTEENTASRETARAALIAEGIYTKAGKLRAQFQVPNERKRKTEAA
ncbi:hypothetical protein ACM61V_06030 [Sphingomonas sp. TX0543]|uniref:hypothetical protein n=1 Tax=unclassified Sphingomonas TaxID=196159 RepID=UPI0010F8DE06|nr:hypothetical protein [Sphingomonas sp. 3P27F8]